MSLARRVTAFLGVLLPLIALATVPASAGARRGDWPTWQGDLTGSRHNAAERRITAATVGGLKLKWAFAYPKTGAPVKSQPAVVDGGIFFGGPDGVFYALDARTGATRWTFALASVNPGAGGAIVLDGPAVARGKVFFGDNRGYVYALDQRTGRLRWATDTETHPAGIHTSSPLYYRGKIYIGASSAENTGDANTPCCTFRGHIDALDADTGRLAWRYWTVPEPKQTGTWPSGAPRYEPSGAGVWSSPVIDPSSGTLYVGTGQNYTGSAGDYDSLLALNARDGSVRWKQQVTRADTWRSLCNEPDAEGYCPGLRDGTALDYDIGATPNLFRVGGRTLVGVGQKSGVYHAFDARTGDVAWRRQIGVPLPSGGISGIQWGSSYDGRRLYVATYFAGPGTLFALDPATGQVLWQTPNPADGCTTGGAAAHPGICALAHTPAATTSPGVVYEGSNDGKMRAYAARTGSVLWEYDTIRSFAGVNGRTGFGGAISGNGGAVVANGMLYVQVGYYPFYPSEHGNVLLAFGL
ncbi:outer membrane protein assembly factor BamB family protein [Actinoplanes aureus]|jgi:polyvinyl alcohol dehydrogenase (cytochrome)|uniref:PQQ-binding-like beta-propeller repeat protein n=1 Tax=Actinoplanes aureus TaxID=2792083 RepID=A0A931CEW3_9ACTN|nr:PQQ-binding-like beta-propeller repeat protein [Actinoplanes aureus]MBG0564933.1 PQQ-binding-like beta-propeller repeat protein [Actinoplanes aureus]